MPSFRLTGLGGLALGGTRDLRLNDAIVGSDITEFEQAGRSGALEESLEGSNLYAPRFQIHLLLARAYGELGDASKAEAHRKLNR